MPGAVNIGVASNGKPLLDMPGQQLHFSLAHSHHQLMIAFARYPVVLDLETPRRVGNCLKIARRLFQPRDIQLLEGVSEQLLQQTFFRLWTAYEASQKMYGEGLFGSRPPASYRSSFMLDDGTIGAACIDAHPATAVEISCFRLDA